MRLRLNELLLKLSIITLFIFLPEFCNANKVRIITETKNYFTASDLPLLAVSDTLNPITGFQMLGVPQPKIARSSIKFWTRLDFAMAEHQEGPFILELLTPHASLIKIFYFDSKGQLIAEKVAGYKFPFASRPDHKNKNLFFDLPNELRESGSILIYSEDALPETFIFGIKNIAEIFDFSVKEYLMLGLYYGFLGLIAAYSLLIFIRLKEYSFLFYATYIASCMLVSTCEDGLGFQFFWPSHPSFNSLFGNWLAQILFLLTFVLYAFSFLDINKYHPRYFKNGVILAGGVLVYMTVCYFFLPNALIRIIYLFPFMYVFYISVKIYKDGYKPARYFILGYSCIVIGVTINVLRNYHIMPASIYMVYSFNIAIIFEALILSLAFTDKMKIVKDDKEKAQKQVIDELNKNQELQEKVNQELEGKVQERTTALSIANQKLERMATQLQEMNASLDRDNFQLNRQIKEEKHARIVSKDVSYEEFIKVFSNDNYCLTWLEELKWKNGYKCRICGNEKFNMLFKLRSRKCTKCNHIESAMSYTLFHGVRSDLNKAFYLAYTVVNEHDYTLLELAEMLDLSKNTISRFRNKVEERIALYKKVNKVNKLFHWEDIITDISIEKKG